MNKVFWVPHYLFPVDLYLADQHTVEDRLLQNQSKNSQNPVDARFTVVENEVVCPSRPRLYILDLLTAQAQAQAQAHFADCACMSQYGHTVKACTHIPVPFHDWVHSPGNTALFRHIAFRIL